MVPARRKGQKLILFGRIKFELMSRQESENENESPQFTHYEPNILRMTENVAPRTRDTYPDACPKIFSIILFNFHLVFAFRL